MKEKYSTLAEMLSPQKKFSAVDALSSKPSILGALRDPQFYKDMGSNLAGLIGTPTPTQEEHNAVLSMLRLGPSVMQSYPSKERELMQSHDRKMMSLAQMAAPVSPTVAKSLNTANKLPTDDFFNSAVRNTPGAQVTPDGLLMRVQRNQQPAQALTPSVRGGVFYLPEGAQQAKHYSTGKTGYGGKDQIIGETLIANPLFVKGATGGKAPESAYDSLLGKGAYQKMRSDALHWGGGPKEIREEAVTKFLETYAPEMADQAWYILQNSTKGNQLAYALQEAAVGSAVRKAGYDAVLGYSMSRNTKQPFISEVFDVREKPYPDKAGTPAEVWDTFLKRK